MFFFINLKMYRNSITEIIMMGSVLKIAVVGRMLSEKCGIGKGVVDRKRV